VKSLFLVGSQRMDHAIKSIRHVDDARSDK
jgi:hypothetical protein